MVFTGLCLTLREIEGFEKVIANLEIPDMRTPQIRVFGCLFDD